MAHTGDSATAEIHGGEPVTGWKLLAKNDSVVEIVDTLLDMPPRREFNQTELAEFAGVSRKSVHNHLPLLRDLDIVETVPGTTPTRYRFVADSEIAEALIRLDGAVNRAGPGATEE